MVLDELEAVLRGRREHPPEASYSAGLVADPERAARKVMEEAYELCVELVREEPDRRRVAEEAADLVFHTLAGLVAVGVPLEDVLAELRERRR
jgi:phosphoribosyl-ATP pyrophosphohydrolase